MLKINNVINVEKCWKINDVINVEKCWNINNVINVFNDMWEICC